MNVIVEKTETPGQNATILDETVTVRPDEKYVFNDVEFAPNTKYEITASESGRTATETISLGSRLGNSELTIQITVQEDGGLVINTMHTDF